MRFSFRKTMKEKHEESYSHVLKYTGIFGGVQGLNILISLIRNKIVAKLLGPGGMGLTSLFNSSVSFISTSTGFGISFSAVRHVSELFEEGNQQKIAHFVKVVRGWSLLAALLGMLVCVLLGPALSNYTFSWGDHTLHFILLGDFPCRASLGESYAVSLGDSLLIDLVLSHGLWDGAGDEHQAERYAEGHS